MNAKPVSPVFRQTGCEPAFRVFRFWVTPGLLCRNSGGNAVKRASVIAQVCSQISNVAPRFLFGLRASEKLQKHVRAFCPLENLDERPAPSVTRQPSTQNTRLA